MRLAQPVQITTALLAATIPSIASAHAGHDHAAGFVQGFAHPFGGMDHVLAMVAVGLLAGRIGGSALWQVPASFIALMAVGAAIGMAEISLPFVEAGIAASIVVFGVLLARSRTVPAALTSVIVGGLAVFHGYAHGAEAQGAFAIAYGCGLMLASAALHFVGASTAMMLIRVLREQSKKTLQLGGGLLMAAGIMTLAGIF